MAEGILAEIVARKRATSPRGSAGVGARRACAERRADAGAASSRGAGPARRALHHGGEARLAVAGRSGRRPTGRARPRLSRRGRRDQRAHRRALLRRLARRSAGGAARSSTGRSSPRISSSIRARWPRRGSTAPTRCWPSSRCSTTRGGGGDGGGAALGMDVLVEAHDEAEVRRAVARRRSIGINNRDLERHEGRSRHHRAARPAGAADRLVVAESGHRPRRRRAAGAAMPTPSWSARR
jgi:hypothetical protein